jgi:hypothetical protein
MKRLCLLTFVLLALNRAAIADGNSRLNNNWRYTVGYEVQKYGMT